MQHIVVLYELDSNTIFVENMQNCMAGEMVKAYQMITDRLNQQGFEPKIHILNNKCSKEFEIVINKNGTKFQLVSPHDHRQNVLEKSPQMFKDHFIAGLCGTDVNFPIQLWYSILRQAEHQLNLL